MASFPLVEITLFYKMFSHHILQAFYMISINNVAIIITYFLDLKSITCPPAACMAAVDPVAVDILQNQTFNLS